MKRTTIMADDRILNRLKQVALDRGVSLAEVVREALEDKASEFRPKPRSIGSGASGKETVSEQTGVERSPTVSWR